jgi:hypothetical protein
MSPQYHACDILCRVGTPVRTLARRPVPLTRTGLCW